MFEPTEEPTAPSAVCAECYERRKRVSLPSGFFSVLTAYCSHTRTGALWSPISGWAASSPLGESDFEEAITAAVGMAAAQLAALRRVLTWMDDRCRKDASARVPLELLYRDYEEWTRIERAGEPVNVHEFEIALKRSGALIDHHRRGTLCVGLRIRRLA